MLDLAGNAAEYASTLSMDRYTANGRDGSDYFVELRGGSFATAAGDLRVARPAPHKLSRVWTMVSEFAEYGFRCAR